MQPVAAPHAFAHTLDRLVTRMTTIRSICRLLIPLVAILPGGIVWAQQDMGAATDRVISAVRVNPAPVIDGKVLDEAVWQVVPAAGGLVQNTPDEGQPASQRTEIRVAYTDDTLYFGIVCYDDDPPTIVISDSRRDADLQETDAIRIILDTYLDGQNGFVFGTNPAGIEYDGQVTNEGSGGPFAFAGRQAAGAGGGFNINWDGAWEVKTSVDSLGWTAEFAIPFNTLRYSNQEAQTWGINVQRNIRRRNESAYWAPIDRQHTLFRLLDAGRLRDLGVPKQRNLKIVPYGLGEMRESGSTDSSTGDFGVDIKYSITPALTLDLTYNTDFAQVEVDEQQVNLNRFNLFFPEKRPFFLENAGQFTVGRPGQVELFFSRRIGISDDGDVLPILGGARVSGKLGRTNVGFLNMQTEELTNLVASDNFSVARVSRDFANRSSLGGLIVNRQSNGDLGSSGDYNRTYALDGRLGIGRYGLVSGFAARTSTPDLTGDDQAFSIAAAYDTPTWTVRFDYTDVGEAFNPEVGFLQRDGGFRRPSIFVLRRVRPNNLLGLHELRPHVSYRGYWAPDGFQQSGFFHMDTHWEWRNGAEIHTGINLTREGVREPFEISEGVVVPPGTYDNEEVQLVAQSNEGGRLSLQLRATIGGFFSGDRVSLGPQMRFRLNERFITEVNWTRNDIELPTGDFTTNLGRLRISYAFTPRIALQALFQYNDVADIWSSNIRFSWLKAANTGLFVVYNDTRGYGAYTGERPERSLQLKFSYLFDVFR